MLDASKSGPTCSGRRRARPPHTQFHSEPIQPAIPARCQPIKRQALRLSRYLPRRRWSIPSRCRTCGGLGGCRRSRRILRWRRLGRSLNAWWRGCLPRACRVSLRTKHSPVANNLLRFGNFYSAVKTVDRHFVLLLSVPAEPVGFSLLLMSIVVANVELAHQLTNPGFLLFLILLPVYSRDRTAHFRSSIGTQRGFVSPEFVMA